LPVQCQTYGYFPSYRALLPFDIYVNNLPKVVTRKQKGRELNRRPLIAEINTNCRSNSPLTR